jgi:hypothetical protein
MFNVSRLSAFALLLFVGLGVTACESRTTRLRRDGDNVIHRIEKYRLRTGKLPTSLAELGLQEAEAGPLYYQRTDTATYEVWFGTSLGESETYSSLTKKWGK